MTKIRRTLAPRCKSILGMIVAGMLLFGGATQAQNMKQKITLTVKKQTKVEISLAANANNTKIQFQQPDMMAMWVNVINTTDTLITISPSNAGTIEIYGDVTTLAIKRNNHNILEIDASGNTALKKIDCMDDSLKSLNVTNCTALTSLEVNYSRISSLDISTNTALTSLHCVNNKNLTSLDISQNVALCTLYCYSNQLTSLDVSQNVALTFLACNSNRLTSLDLSKNTALTYLACSGNLFTTAEYDAIMCSLPMKDTSDKARFFPLMNSLGTNATKFAASNSLNAKAKNWSVQYIIEGAEIPATTGDYECPFFANNNRYITLTLNVTKDNLISIRLATDSANTPIKIVSGAWDTTIIAKNKETGDIECKAEDETMTIYGDVKAFYCNDNETKVTGIDISNNTALCTLSCYRNQLTSLDVSKNTALTDLNCDNSQLTSLDVSQNTALCTLNCSFNKLTSLDVSACTSLVELYCVTNSLTSLNVSGCTSLTTLSFYNNSLTSLDVSTCTSLKNLDCSTNSFTSLNVSGCTSLVYLDCHGNKFSTAGYDSLICSLPSRSSNDNARFAPLYDANDTNAAKFVAANASNATAKNWQVVYIDNNNPITTSGNYDCNGGGGTPEDTTSISEVNLSNIALYPNPAKTVLNIENATENVQIFDITGRLLINVENKETNLLQINVSNLAKGMYFIKIGNYTTKFVKE